MDAGHRRRGARVGETLIVRTLWLWMLCAAAMSAQAPAKCVTCHESDLIEQQRLTRNGWDREIAKMERWGATLSPDERSELLAELANRFGPQPASNGDVRDIAAGEPIYRAACRSCHDDDLRRQQRLSRSAWERTIDKMVRWGAAVTTAQKGPLAAYLASEWGDGK
jgi:hypothetical protein